MTPELLGSPQASRSTMELETPKFRTTLARRRGFISKPSEETKSRAQARGFTLIEILVVISIMGLIAVTAIPSLADFVRRQQLAQSGSEVLSTLRDAQSRAISSVGGLNWGVHFVANQNNFELFSSPALNYTASTDKTTHQLITDITISDLTVNQNGIVNVIFSPVTGKVVFVDDNGNCLGGSADSSCSSSPNRCLAIGLNLQGGSSKRYVKVNERNTFESPTLTPCP